MSYRNNTKQKEYQKQWSHEKKQAVLKYIRLLKAQPCKDCNVSYSHWVMEFDHVRGLKKFTIGKSGMVPRKILDEEIAKCDIVCANCHNDRTWKRAQSADH